MAAFGFDHSDPGAMYKALRRLEAEGLVRSDWERSDSGPRKRVYTLTSDGVEELDHRATDLAEGERRIDAFLERYSGLVAWRPAAVAAGRSAARREAHRAAVTDRRL